MRSMTSFFEKLGFSLLFLCPPFVFYETHTLALDQRLFLSLLSATVVMWMFRLFPDFIAGIFLLCMTLVLGIVPSKIVLGGLASETFILVMSVYALTILLTDAHLDKWILRLLRFLPPSILSYHIVLCLMGFLLTPIIPSIINRTQLIVPFLKQGFDLFHLKENTHTLTHLTFTAFTSVTAFSSVFLSSSLMNFVVLSFLPAQEQFQFQWLGWLYGALIYGLTTGMGFVGFMIYFGYQSSNKLNKTLLKKHITPILPREKLIVGMTLLYAVGILTYTYHKISLGWLSLSLLFILLGTHLFTKRDFDTRIDWGFLIFLSSAIGLTACFNFLSLDDIFSHYLVKSLNAYITEPFYFYGFIMGLTLILRLILPIPSAVVLLSSVCIPLALRYGYSTWITSFIILTMADMWFLPYQNFFYISFSQDLKHHDQSLYREKTFLLLNSGMNLFKLVGLILSLYYWQG